MTSVWRDLLSSRAALRTVAAYSFDIVDVTRQVLGEVFDGYLDEFRAAYAFGRLGVTHAKQMASKMAILLLDLDTMFNCDINWMFGGWVWDARAWSTVDAERALLEMNARNLVTLWGPDGQRVDASARAWGGLMENFQLPRWKLFFNWTITAMEAGVDFNQVLTCRVM